MNDRLFYPLIGVVAVLLIAFAAVWPQGMGARSPGPFGHTPEQQRPEVRAALEREKARAALAAQAQGGEDDKPQAAPAAPSPAPAAAPAGGDALR